MNKKQSYEKCSVKLTHFNGQVQARLESHIFFPGKDGFYKCKDCNLEVNYDVTYHLLSSWDSENNKTVKEQPDTEGWEERFEKEFYRDYGWQAHSIEVKQFIANELANQEKGWKFIVKEYKRKLRQAIKVNKL